MAATIVIVPDIGGIDRRHWLAHWKSNYPDLMRVAEYDTSDAVCNRWMRGIEDAVRSAGSQTCLVAHGLGCIAVAHWAGRTSCRVEAAMMVSIPNLSDGSKLPARVSGYTPAPRAALPFRTMIVASEEEGEYQHAITHASDWHADLVVVESISHRTAPRCRHTWDEGLDLLRELVRLPMAM